MNTVSNLEEQQFGLFKCYTCRDGALNKDCQECGRKKNKHSGKVKEIMTEKDYDVLLVPQAQRGKMFDKTVLVESHAEYKNDRTFLSYATTLDKIHETVKQGNVPSKSAIIVAPRTFGKITFAYSCLQLAELAGMKTFPLMDTQEISRFLTMQEEKPFQRVSGFGENFKWTYEDFLMADVLFITITKGFMKQKAYAVIEQVMDMRSRYGRSTIVISAFPLADLIGFDKRGTAPRMISRNEDSNRQRYPVIVQFFDHTNAPQTKYV